DVMLVEQRLRLQVIEHQPHAAHIAALQEIRVAIGPAVARVVDDRGGPGRRLGILGARLGLAFGQGLAAPYRRRRLFHARLPVADQVNLAASGGGPSAAGPRRRIKSVSVSVKAARSARAESEVSCSSRKSPPVRYTPVGATSAPNHARTCRS